MEVAVPYQQVSEREGVKRGFWLTSLIVGTSILVWLTLLGSAVLGIGLAFEANNISNAFNNNNNTPASSQTRASSDIYTDADGFACLDTETDSSGFCPNNTNSAFDGQ